MSQNSSQDTQYYDANEYAASREVPPENPAQLGIDQFHAEDVVDPPAEMGAVVIAVPETQKEEEEERNICCTSFWEQCTPENFWTNVQLVLTPLLVIIDFATDIYVVYSYWDADSPWVFIVGAFILVFSQLLQYAFALFYIVLEKTMEACGQAFSYVILSICMSICSGGQRPPPPPPPPVDSPTPWWLKLIGGVFFLIAPTTAVPFRAVSKATTSNEPVGFAFFDILLKKLHLVHCLETLVESAPQLFLQLYVMTFDSSEFFASPRTLPEHVIQTISLFFSLLSYTFAFWPLFSFTRLYEKDQWAVLLQIASYLSLSALRVALFGNAFGAYVFLNLFLEIWLGGLVNVCSGNRDTCLVAFPSIAAPMHIFASDITRFGEERGSTLLPGLVMGGTFHWVWNTVSCLWPILAFPGRCHQGFTTAFAVSCAISGFSHIVLIFRAKSLQTS